MMQVIYVVRFVTWCSWGVLYPFLAIWLLRLGLFDGGTVGVIVGGAVLANRIGSLLFVRFVERLSKRDVVLISQAVVVVTALAMHVLSAAGSRSPIGWAGAALAFGLANAVATLAQITFIATQFPSGEAKKAFSYENVALNLAAAIAPLLSSLVLTRWPSYYALGPVAIALTSMVVTLWMPRDRPGVVVEAEQVATAARRWTVTLFLVINFLTVFGYAQFSGLFAAYATPEIGEVAVGVLFASSSLTIVAGQMLVTRMSRRIDDVALMVAANVILAVGTMLLIVTNIPALLGAVLAITLAEMIFGPIYQSLAVHMFAGRATIAMASVTFAWGMSETIAIVAGFQLFESGHAGSSFALGAAACVICAFLVLRLGKAIPGPKKPSPIADVHVHPHPRQLSGSSA